MSLWSALFSRPARTPVYPRPSLTLFFLLAGAFLLTLVPQAVQFPLWLTVTVIGAMVLRSIIEVYRLPLPSTTFCGIMAIVLLGLILVQFRGNVLGRDPGTAFTAGLLAIKFYELHRPRDVALIIFSCFFMVMSALLYSQMLELFIYCLIMMWVLTALLLRVHTGDLPHDHLLRMLGQSGIIFLQALPLALVFFFFFFPRYTGKLSLTLDESPIGLTDKVTPGSIAKLAQDDSEAMYVQFNSGSVPTIDTMYWRALVLWAYNNGTWTQGDIADSEIPSKPPTAPDSDLIKQEITVRPHNQKWLFALDVPVSEPINTAAPSSWATLLRGNIVQLRYGKLDHMARYTVVSLTTRTDEELSSNERINGTTLPLSQIDPKVKKLADQLHQGLTDNQELEYVYAILKHFRRGGFAYNTTPGIQGRDWLTNFLFVTKTGFCEHFASAFAILMRVEHIPARLVVGYQGAEYNPYTNGYTVYQSNAHAWDEVWIKAKSQTPASKEEQGRWIRVDPTAILAMSEEGLPANNSANALDSLAIQIAHHRPTFSETWLPTWARDSLKEMQLRREQVETDWDNVVLSYDPETQYHLAQALGFGEKAQVELLLVCLVAGGVCFIVFQKWMARKPPVSPVETLYSAFCRNMAQRGIPRAAWEGPLAYTERVAEAFPDEKLAIHRVGSIVAHVRYGPTPLDPATPDHLKSLLNLITASQAAATSRERR